MKFYQFSMASQLKGVFTLGTLFLSESKCDCSQCLPQRRSHSVSHSLDSVKPWCICVHLASETCTAHDRTQNRGRYSVVNLVILLVAEWTRVAFTVCDMKAAFCCVLMDSWDRWLLAIHLPLWLHCMLPLARIQGRSSSLSSHYTCFVELIVNAEMHVHPSPSCFHIHSNHATVQVWPNLDHLL